MKYTDEWQDYVTRQARWVDFDNDYKTLEPDLMESVLWAFKTLYDKGLVYEGFRVPAVLLERRDPAVQPRAADGRGGLQEPPGPGRSPCGIALETGELRADLDDHAWTLPSNLALAVGPDIDYVVVESELPGRTERYLLRRGPAGRIRHGAGRRTPPSASSQRLKGRDLVGRAGTRRRSPTSSATPRRRTSGAGRPTTSPPTTAPASSTSRPPSVRTTSSSATQHGIAPVVPVDAGAPVHLPGRRLRGPARLRGQRRHHRDLKATTRASDRGGHQGTVLLRQETYDHSYPHCWRCREPADLHGGVVAGSSR